MKLKKAGMLTKILVLTLMVVALTSLLDLRGQVNKVEAECAQLEQRVAVQQQENQALAAAIADSDNPARIADVARERLGLVAPGEIVFSDAGK